ncbi:hypothetical protein QJS10_CPA09g01814 [Acorus calamus]|uniref:Peptidase A2 domain-containing protein n=1 Tax=Acorus calamus TaxID=4465 RepID=A0AAV9E2F3_ACOCL|nr:hypothetical protein QJS10_CPA09g01814 [Acorus calamus]
MDTGTPMTILFKDVYDELVSKLIEKITLSVELQDSQNLCYLGTIQELENRKLVPMREGSLPWP